jgi:hypothetical protein
MIAAAAVAAAALLIAAFEAPAPAALPRYVAIGTSETLGLGLSAGAAYPYLVAKSCGLALTIDAAVAATALPDTVRPGAAITTIFWSPDFFIAGDAAANLRRLRVLVRHAARAGSVTVIIAPLTSAIPALAYQAGVARIDRASRTSVRRIAVAAGADVIDLAALRIDPARDFQTDGLHPSTAAQRTLASAVIGRLEAAGRHCTRSARPLL